jgi:hypothetical protein
MHARVIFAAGLRVGPFPSQTFPRGTRQPVRINNHGFQREWCSFPPQGLRLSLGQFARQEYHTGTQILQTRGNPWTGVHPYISQPPCATVLASRKNWPASESSCIRGPSRTHQAGRKRRNELAGGSTVSGASILDFVGWNHSHPEKYGFRRCTEIATSHHPHPQSDAAHRIACDRLPSPSHAYATAGGANESIPK